MVRLACVRQRTGSAARKLIHHLIHHPLTLSPLICRSASRVGQRDGNANRKRIKALRLELQKKGWRSLGY